MCIRHSEPQLVGNYGFTSTARAKPEGDHIRVLLLGRDLEYGGQCVPVLDPAPPCSVRELPEHYQTVRCHHQVAERERWEVAVTDFNTPSVTWCRGLGDPSSQWQGRNAIPQAQWRTG